MEDDTMISSRAALKRIDPAARDAVIEWLRSISNEGEVTALKLRAANVAIRDRATEETAKYWQAVAGTARMLASRLQTARRLPAEGKAAL